MGVMIQKVVIFSVTDPVYDRWKAERIPFMKITGLLALTTFTPPFLLGFLNYAMQRAQGHWGPIIFQPGLFRDTYVISACTTLSFIGGHMLFKHMSQWTDLLKDELYLVETELRNYDKSEEEQGDKTRKTGSHTAEGPIPDALLNQQAPEPIEL